MSCTNFIQGPAWLFHPAHPSLSPSHQALTHPFTRRSHISHPLRVEPPIIQKGFRKVLSLPKHLIRLKQDLSIVAFQWVGVPGLSQQEFHNLTPRSSFSIFNFKSCYHLSSRRSARRAFPVCHLGLTSHCCIRNPEPEHPFPSRNYH